MKQAPNFKKYWNKNQEKSQKIFCAGHSSDAESWITGKRAFLKYFARGE